MATSTQLFLFLLLFLLFFSSASEAQIPGFVSIDCGGTASYTDDLGLVWTADTEIAFGKTANILVSSEHRTQYKTLRYFPADEKKYCYTLNVTTRTRYLIRATFLYGNFDHSNAFPEFDMYVGASHWSTIVIYDESRIVTKELVMLASSATISVCLSNATTGQPFISTLELRQLNGSLYYTRYETELFLGLSARINFGAPTTDPVRYPDDPFDRIWESDLVKRANYLVDVAPGTKNISTSMPIYVSSNERPPQKVMQTAVVGSHGSLTYRLNLDGFPGNGWAFSYFAEIEDSPLPETRKFKLFIPGLPDVSKPTVDIYENAPGKYRLYQPGYFNISLPFVLSFEFRKTNNSTRGPILNAFEIYKYIPINLGSPDAPVMGAFLSSYPFADWAQEGGDPCLPSPWSWVQCSADPKPRIIAINLSNKNLAGNIPLELANLSGLQQIRLDNNRLTGPIPDFGRCLNLTVIHFENNQLSGSLPSYLIDLPNLKELYLQNNVLSGIIPRDLLNKNIIFNYSGNTYLAKEKEARSHIIIIIPSLLGVAFLLAVALCCYMLVHKRIELLSTKGECDDLTKVLPRQKLGCFSGEIATETARPYKLSDLEVATGNFENRIGSGGFGTVYYGRLKDGKEIAVKVPTNDSYQGKKQFTNEVSLLSRIHHRNLVAFLGYCHQDGKNILVYDFMHNGTLKEHLHGRGKHISWIKRLEIAEDSAKGIEYLHTGCTPAIIHRDIKTSNILLDKHMKAKVSDFGLSKLAADESHASTNVRGTLGYLDPQYYISQQLTEKSDVYSFGVILLELISGRQPISDRSFGEHFRNIGAWAKFYYESGDIEAIIDPSIRGEYSDIQSIWKIAETAVRCIDLEPRNRPSMSEVLKEVQDAIALERPPLREKARDSFSPTMRTHDMIMDNLMQDDSFTDSLKYPELR